MEWTPKLVKLIFSYLLVLAATSCGGGGSSGSAGSAPIITSNSAPSATDLEIVLEEDTQYSGAFEFTDPDGDSLTYELVEEASHGVFELESQGNYKYVPTADFFGSDSIVLRVSLEGATRVVQH